MRKSTVLRFFVLVLCALLVACAKEDTPITVSPIGQTAIDGVKKNGLPLFSKRMASFILYKNGYYYLNVEELREQCHDIQMGEVNCFPPSYQSPSVQQEEFLTELGRVPMVVNPNPEERLGGSGYSVEYAMYKGEQEWFFSIHQLGIEQMTVYCWHETQRGSTSESVVFSIDPHQGRILRELFFNEHIGTRIIH